MRAIWNNKVIAEADKSNLLRIEGNWYFPQPMSGSIDRVKKDFTNYVAFWRGVVVSE